MITGQAIAESMTKIFRRKRNIYEPARDRLQSKLPVTMRQLVEGSFDLGGEDDGSCNFGIFVEPGRVQESKVPLAVTDLRATYLELAEEEFPKLVDDYRNFYPLLSSFWLWIKKRNVSCRIDHPLTGYWQDWPLWKRFETTLKIRTGLAPEDIFVSIDMDNDYGSDDVGEFEMSGVYMPLYNAGSYDNDVPLLEFFESIRGDDIHFPQCVFEYCVDVQVYEAELILGNLINDQRYELLDDNWWRAVIGIKNYKGQGFSFTDCEECRLYIQQADYNEIDYLFECCKDVNDMLLATGPLVSECIGNSELFWRKLVDTLIAAGEKNPKLKRYKEGILING